MTISADNIATFVEVVRQKSLSAAARSLGLPKSTVSRRLKRLEEELESKLMHRDARKATLTAAGRRFFESVVGAVDALDAAVEGLSRSDQEPRGSIRITAPPDLGRMVLSPMFVAFLERYPDISLDIMLTNRLVDLAEEGVDLAVRAGQVIKGDLIARRLCTSSLQLSVASNGSVPQSIEDLRALPFVLYRAAAQKQTLKLEHSSRKRARSAELTVSGRINVDDYAAMAELLAEGHGVGLLPAIHVEEGVKAGRLKRVFPEWSSPAANIHLVYPARQQPRRVRLLNEFLLARFAQLGSV